MEDLLPHTINKTVHKALEDIRTAGKIHAQTWGKKEKRKERDTKKKFKKKENTPL